MATASIAERERSAVAALSLEPAEQGLLAQEVPAFAQALPDPQVRERYTRLAAAVEAGAVPEELLGALETMLELVLQTQRVRREHGPAGEKALLDVYYRTPRGRGLRQSVKETNEGLAALEGQVLQSLKFSPTPGGQRLTIATDACEVTLVIDRSGVRVDRLELGG